MWLWYSFFLVLDGLVTVAKRTQRIIKSDAASTGLLGLLVQRTRPQGHEGAQIAQEEELRFLAYSLHPSFCHVSAPSWKVDGSASVSHLSQCHLEQRGAPPLSLAHNGFMRRINVCCCLKPPNLDGLFIFSLWSTIGTVFLQFSFVFSFLETQTWSHRTEPRVNPKDWSGSIHLEITFPFSQVEPLPGNLLGPSL